MGLINDMAKNIEAQDTNDTGGTADPIYMVQEKRRIYGVDLDYTEHTQWVEKENSETFFDTEEERDSYIAECKEDDPESDPPEFREVGYIDIWVHIQPFFTRQGAERYIAENAHNLNEPRVYVESAYRNKEWQAIRSLLVEDYGFGSKDEDFKD